MRYHKDKKREEVTPLEALEYLKLGNERFRSNLTVNSNLLQIVDETKNIQAPFVSILSCSDSRVPVELVFDQSLGDIFSVRLAGNIASKYAIGSLEFACKSLKTKLIVVLGHTSCGAVKGACDNVLEGNLFHIMTLIKPAISAEDETSNPAERSSENKQFVNNVTHLNVQQQITSIIHNSSTIREMLSRKEIAIAGGVYDISTGKVTFQNEDYVIDVDHHFKKITKQFLYD